MTRAMKDGWHEVKGGIRYYVEGGWIVRGVSGDGQNTLYPYRWDTKQGCYVQQSFRAYYGALSRIHWA